ncbi:cytochrome c [Burkholderia plantarii]|uniref:cytochrome c n=1 Tax=Burkholderia plantarii TaxID=41899 RepID=UPI0027298675|nr:c-type cytochrome [Burkholderia plantarii]WLE59480.1 cytochrome c [Burkholderia plantarii]
MRSRWRTVMWLAACLVVLAGVAWWFARPRPIDALASVPVVSPQSEPARRGAVLAAAGDCMVCHTARNGSPYAGGRPLATPFGAIESTNITPDPDTGIGRWSVEAFARAMRRGISRDGHHLYPAFPYPHFTKLSDADIAALYAFLMSRRPAVAPPPRNHLAFPFDHRPLVAFWNLLFLHEGPQPPDPARPADWNRGRYLVDALGHCGACHTPMNRLGAEQPSHAFRGGLIDGWDAPALNALNSGGSGAPRWTASELADYLHDGFSSAHGAAAGPMRPVTDSLRQVPRAEVEAIAAYLMSLDPGPAAPPPPAPGPRSLAPNPLFEGACASCHAAGSPMQIAGARPPLSNATSLHAGSPRNAVRMILDGNGWDGSHGAYYMPGFANLLTDEQIAQLARYVHDRHGSGQSWPDLDAAYVARLRKETAP